MPAWEKIGVQSDPEISTLEIKRGGMRICVTNGHIGYKPQWIMHCHTLGIDTRPLRGAKSAEDAIWKALFVVDAELSNLAKDFAKIKAASNVV